MLKKIIVLSIFILVSSISLSAKKVVTPLNYGLLTAKNGIERYGILLKCHQDAVKNGYDVSYNGIESIYLEIPHSPQSIPLPDFVDFAGVEITVDNTQKGTFLFSKKKEYKDIQVNASDIDNGDYRGYSNINGKGHFLLTVEDKIPWSDRINYDEKVIRKDAILIKNGKSRCRPILTYNTPSSLPYTKYCRVTPEKKVIKNLSFVRTASSTAKTYLFSIDGEYNLTLDNIRITTPENDKEYADFAIHIVNSVALSLKNITINGTYSLERKVGYGVYLNNINDLKVENMFARAKWGVFGTHNLQHVLLKKCDINRFDIHTYGRDVKAVDCKFSNLYNQFSSVYGEIYFKKCIFENEIPVLIESSYNAYTPFELKFKDCTFHLNEKINYLMTLFGVPEPYNERPELRRKCLPNITVKDCDVVLADGVDKWYLIKTGGVRYKDSFDYITNITMKNVKVKGNRDVDFEMSTEPLKTTYTIKTKVLFKI